MDFWNLGGCWKYAAQSLAPLFDPGVAARPIGDFLTMERRCDEEERRS